MRIVVADASPLIVLANIGRVDLLRDVFGTVLIPPAVDTELRSPARSDAVRNFVASDPSWLQVRTPTAVTRIPLLHKGETAAIRLVEDLAPALLLIDERRGRAVARARGIKVMGTIGFLELAANEGKVELAEAFAEIKASDFWVSPAKLDQVLAEFHSRSPVP